jgi:hypothetical protein
MTKGTSVATAAALIGLVLPVGAAASGNDVRSKGTCSGNSTSKIKVKPDNGRLQVEFEVDQNRNGQDWRVKLKDNSDVVVRDTATTKPPSGSFSFERRIDDRSGKDSIVGVARNKASGERCTAKVTI